MPGLHEKAGQGRPAHQKAEESGTGGKEFLEAWLRFWGRSISEIESEIKQQMKEQREEWLANWLEKNSHGPIASHMVIRYFAGSYGQHALHRGIQSPEQAVAYARRFVRENCLKVCLPVTPTISVWFDKDGSIEFLTDAVQGQLNLPSVRLEESGE